MASLDINMAIPFPLVIIRLNCNCDESLVYCCDLPAQPWNEIVQAVQMFFSVVHLGPTMWLLGSILFVCDDHLFFFFCMCDCLVCVYYMYVCVCVYTCVFIHA